MRKSILLSSLLVASAVHAAPLFDLVASRTLGHTQRQGGLLIAAGAPGFAKYVHFSRPLPGWKLRQAEDGKKVAIARTQSQVDVPLTAEQAKRPTIAMELKSPTKQTVRVTASGKTVQQALEVGWQTVSIALPDGALVAGENTIRFNFSNPVAVAGQKSGAYVHWMLIGGSGALDVATLPKAGELTLTKGGGASYFVQVPKGGQLIVNGDAGGCQLKAHAQAHGGKPMDMPVNLGATVDLNALSDQVVRLDLLADGATCTGAKIKSATLGTAAPAPTVTRVPPPKNIVFWLTDSTRADKYRAINPKTRVETPVMDALSKKATIFRTAYVQGNESRVSHASLFTSMYPAVHNFISGKAILDSKFTTLAEVIKPAGLYTQGYMANGYITARWGFGEGWDSLKNHIHDGGGLKAEDLVKVGKDFMKAKGDKPFFLYLGTIDAHVSWRAHEPWLSKYDPEPYSGRFVKACLDPDLDKIVAGTLPVNERDKVRIKALYDCDVSYNDHHLGELMKALEASGHKDDTLIVLTADHGEEMWDHGKIGHGQSIHEELVHVPLMMYYPPLFPAKLVEEGVEVIDILPTLAEALGQKIPDEAQGESLIGLAQGEGAGYPRPAVASQYELAHTMRLSKYKLWVGGSGEVRLNDMYADPTEAKNLAAERPIELRFVTDAMGTWMAYQKDWKKRRWGVASNHKPQLAADLEK